MISREENQLLTQTGEGTPCGELMRRYWQPVALAEELKPNGAPVAVKLLGTELVVFRDERGRVGVLDAHCCHRGADLSYGRLEDGGLRCIYHGWLYDVNGRFSSSPANPTAASIAIAIASLRLPVRKPAAWCSRISVRAGRRCCRTMNSSRYPPTSTLFRKFITTAITSNPMKAISIRCICPFCTAISNSQRSTKSAASPAARARRTRYSAPIWRRASSLN